MNLRTGLFLLALTLTASAACAQERQWLADQNDTDAFLLFGVPDSDDAALTFWCTKGTGTATLFLPSMKPGLTGKSKVKVLLEAGDKHFAVAGKVTTNDKDKRITGVEVALPTDDKLFSSLKTADKLSVSVAGAAPLIVPLQDADVDSLISACAKP